MRAAAHRCVTQQHGLSSNKMALITSDCGTTRSQSIKLALITSGSCSGH